VGKSQGDGPESQPSMWLGSVCHSLTPHTDTHGPAPSSLRPGNRQLRTQQATGNDNGGIPPHHLLHTCLPRHRAQQAATR
jgi:hypothetical protein